MILERSTEPGWLSNSFLVAPAPGGAALIVDAGAPPEPLVRRIEQERLSVEWLLLTHHHRDHVLHAASYRERFGCRIAGPRRERDRLPGLDLELDGGEVLGGTPRIEVLFTPGHTSGMLAYLVEGQWLFPGDTLFRGSVGSTTADGHGTLDELRRSVLDVLLALPTSTRVLPGHGEATTVGEERERNPFVRLWHGRDAPGTTRCSAWGQPATLLLRAADYDGGTKCHVRFEDGREEIVPGSRVTD